MTPEQEKKLEQVLANQDQLLANQQRIMQALNLQTAPKGKERLPWYERPNFNLRKATDS